jgi:hypothetical protein
MRFDLTIAGLFEYEFFLFFFLEPHFARQQTPFRPYDFTLLRRMDLLDDTFIMNN